MHVEGLISIPCESEAAATLRRLRTGIAAAGFELFSEIDHAKNAADAALTLKFCTLVIFGNAKAGTPLMQANPLTGIDLPLKALVWEDAGGKVWISYNDPLWIAKRHGLPAELMDLAAKMRGGLEKLVAAAALSR